MHLDQQKASVKIGPLVCKGERIYPGKSCETWRNLGFPSGYYITEVKNMNYENSM